MKKSSLLLIFCLIPALAEAQASAYTLKVINPLASGSAGIGKSATDVLYFAHTGVAYRTHARAIGGTPFYTWTLTNAPAGMTIVNAGAGETCGIAYTGVIHVPCGRIDWPNPTSDANNIQVCATDRVSAQNCVTYSIDVNDAKFKVINSACVGCDTSGAGTLADPWQTLGKIRTSGGAGNFAILRSGTYTLTATGTSGDCFDDWTINDGSHPTTFIGYPGETAIIDQGTADGPCIEISGSDAIHFSNLTFLDCQNICTKNGRSNRYGMYYADVIFDGVGPGVNETNSSFIEMSRSDDAPTYYDIIVEVEMRNMNYGEANSCIKMYSNLYMLIENVYFHDILNWVGTEREGCIAVKDSAQHFTIRANNIGEDFEDEVPCISGNMHQTGTIPTTGEFAYNKCVKTSTTDAYNFNQDSQVLELRHYRNTWHGVVTARNMTTGQGPVSFTNEVVVNAGGSGNCPQRITASSSANCNTTVTVSESTQGAAADNITNAAGELQGAYATSYLGSRGFQSVPTISSGTTGFWNLLKKGEFNYLDVKNQGQPSIYNKPYRYNLYMIYGGAALDVISTHLALKESSIHEINPLYPGSKPTLPQIIGMKALSTGFIHGMLKYADKKGNYKAARIISRMTLIVNAGAMAWNLNQIRKVK